MEFFKKLIIHPNFEKTLNELNNKDIFLPYNGTEQNFDNFQISRESGKLVSLEDTETFNLNAKNGSNQVNNFTSSAYDESFIKFEALEGAAYFTAHAVVLTNNKEYIPNVLVSFNFYTRSKTIADKSHYVQYSDNPELSFKRDYLTDKVEFLLSNVPSNSILFIDGPLIAGDLYTLMIDANKKFLEKDIIPIFITKNSSSNIVTESTENLRGRYNSDLHWIQSCIKRGQRSRFFKYEDQVNKKNTKVFCYLKAFELIPQRVELHTDTYLKHKANIPTIMDIILYLMLLQGSKNNPQLRPIIIAEMYARSILSYINIHKYFKEMEISPTLNEIRFGG